MKDLARETSIRSLLDQLDAELEDEHALLTNVHSAFQEFGRRLGQHFLEKHQRAYLAANSTEFMLAVSDFQFLIQA